MKVLYQLRGVSKTYTTRRHRNGAESSVTALRDINLDIRDGEFLGVIGRSGGGKSTLLNLLGGLDQPTEGTIYFLETSLADCSPVVFRRDHVGFVFQMFHLLGGRSVLDNVALGLTVAGCSSREARKLAEHWLGRLGLADRRHHVPAELSGGERQRVAIARAMVKSPQVLLADEPTGNLDRTNREGVLTALAEVHRETGTTVIMVTHSSDDAHAYGQRVVHVDGGITKETVPTHAQKRLIGEATHAEH